VYSTPLRETNPVINQIGPKKDIYHPIADYTDNYPGAQFLRQFYRRMHSSTTAHSTEDSFFPSYLFVIALASFSPIQ
jgi:hypothetical protein